MTDPFMLQPFACGVELLLRTLPSKCIARVTLLPERRTSIAKLVRPTLQCLSNIGYLPGLNRLVAAKHGLDRLLVPFEID